MMKTRVIAILAIGFCQTLSALAQEETPIRLPLKVHVVTGVEMAREAAVPGADPVRTVMNMPVKEEDVRAMVDQVNEIWAPARIHWETDPAKGGGGIVTEQAGGGKLSAEKLRELAQQVVARSREDSGDCMTKVFPALADPAQNTTPLADGDKATFY